MLYQNNAAFCNNKEKVITARYKWELVVTELFNIAVNDSDAKKSDPYSRLLAVTELVVSGNQCKQETRMHFSRIRSVRCSSHLLVWGGGRGCV